MKARTGIILLLLLSVILAAVLMLALVRDAPFFAADVEPIPAPPRSARPSQPRRHGGSEVVRRLESVRQIPQDVAGIGVVINVRPEDGALRIMQVISNSPAFHAGLEKGWIVERIDEQPTSGMPLRECVDRLRGVVGSKVRLELASPDLDRTNVVELTRQRLQVGKEPSQKLSLP